LIAANYILDLFNTSNPQQLTSLGYSFRTKKNTMGFRLNYADRFNKNDVQLETDFYLLLNKGKYMYFNYGYAFMGTLFPRHRIGYEYFFPIESKTEASIGGRYLNYPNSHVFIFTGNLTKYFNKSRVTVRPFCVTNYTETTRSFKQSITCIGNYRLLDKNELDYWGVEIGLGNSPDDIYATTQSGGFNQLMAYKVKLEKNIMVSMVSDLHIGLGYSREGYGTGKYFRNRYTVELGYKYRMK
jgi:YaiO family outer membrane protein